MKIESFIFIAVILIAFFAHAQKDDTITWIRWDDPPIFIIDGKFKDQGLLDNVENTIRSQLPQFNHKNLVGTVPRVLKEAEAKSATCNAGWLDTPEWRKLFYFSKPVFIIPSNGILAQKNLTDVIREKSPVSLFKTISTLKDKTLGIGRLYGEGIDEVLNAINYKQHPQIAMVPTSYRVHLMLHTGRIDYTLGYPFEAVYYNKLLSNKSAESGPLKVKTILHTPVSENNPFVEVVVACPKTPWGKKVIEEVNKVLSNKSILKKFEDGVDKWLAPADIQRLSSERKSFYKRNYPELTNTPRNNN